jgi:DNA repair exonuclease SbcCD ATPase subunit
MSLATLPRARAPVIVPRSPARSRVLAAANELRRAVDQLFEEAKQEAREKAKRDEENDRKAEAHVARARARLATKEYRIEVSKKWLEELAQTALDALGEQADAAKSIGRNALANQLSNRIDHLIADLQRLGLMERPKENKTS